MTFCPLEGHCITIYPKERLPIGNFIVFYPLEKLSRGWFITFFLLEGQIISTGEETKRALYLLLATEKAH